MARKRAGQKSREICKCGRRPVAINYIKVGITHYRSVCSTCSKDRKKRKENAFPNYTKKRVCEKCGFKPVFDKQLVVFTVPNPPMLKTVCLNCNKELAYNDTWNQGDLVADF